MKQSHTFTEFSKLEAGSIGLWQFSKAESTPEKVMRRVSGVVSTQGKKVKQEFRYTFDKSLNEVGYLVIAEMLKS